MTGVVKVSRKHWYLSGGFANPRHFRKHNGSCWEYFVDLRAASSGNVEQDSQTVYLRKLGNPFLAAGRRVGDA